MSTLSGASSFKSSRSNVNQNINAFNQATSMLGTLNGENAVYVLQMLQKLGPEKTKRVLQKKAVSEKRKQQLRNKRNAVVGGFKTFGRGIGSFATGTGRVVGTGVRGVGRGVRTAVLSPVMSAQAAAYNAMSRRKSVVKRRSNFENMATRKVAPNVQKYWGSEQFARNIQAPGATPGNLARRHVVQKKRNLRKQWRANLKQAARYKQRAQQIRAARPTFSWSSLFGRKA